MTTKQMRGLLALPLRATGAASAEILYKKGGVSLDGSVHVMTTGDSFPGFREIGHFGPEEMEGWAVPRQHRAGTWDTERCGMAGLHLAGRPASAASAHLRRPPHRGAGDAGAGGRDARYPDCSRSRIASSRFPMKWV